MTSPDNDELPPPVLDALFRILYGDESTRNAELSRLRAAHPTHSAAITAHVDEFARQRREFDPDTVPGSFASFRVLGQLGEGAHGRVLLAEEPPPMRRRVAVKVFRPLPRLADRFRAEVEAIASLNHDHIAKVFAAGEHDGEPFLVLEYVEAARSIGRYCREHLLPLLGRVRLFLQACHAIQHAHERGVLHLDLKPGNILVAEQEGRTVLKIVDFGQARVLTEGKAGAQVGTPPYMASEQLEGGGVDARADVHALGVTLYELLADRLPHEEHDLTAAGSTAQLRALYLREVPPPSARLRSFLDSGGTSCIRPRDLRGDLDWVVRRAIARHADDRYATARDLALDLQRFLDHRPVQARPATAAYHARKFVRRRQRALLAGVAALVLGGTGFIYWAGKPVQAATTEPFRIGADSAAQLQPDEVRPGDVLGVVVDLPRPARIGAVSLSTAADGSVYVNYTEPNLRAKVDELRHEVLLPLPAGRHEILLCHADRRDGATGWREGLWVFVLEDEDTAPALGQWLEHLRGAIQEQRNRSPLVCDSALELLRGLFADDGVRGGPLDDLPAARRDELAAAFGKWTGDADNWPLASPRPQVYWWQVHTTARR